MTNLEYIRNTNDEEFIIFLESLRGCPPPLYYGGCPEEDELQNCLPNYSQCINCWKKWLISPYKTNIYWRGCNDN